MRIADWRILATGALSLGGLIWSACGGGSELAWTSAVPSVSVSISPPAPVVAVGGTLNFTATVTGSVNTAVSWTVTEGTMGGSIASNGFYTAPPQTGVFHVLATCVVDTSKSAAVTITVITTGAACASEPVSPVVLDVKASPFLAKGDGTTDDTKAIQDALNAMNTSGIQGTVLIPSGTYMINAAQGGISVKSNTTLRFSPGATLKAIPNSADNYTILSLDGASNINVVGAGTLMGERASHGASTGEWGHGITIGNAHNVVVENLTLRDCWGDGIYIGGASTQVTLCNVVADNNRRAGISITSVNGLAIRNSVFRNTTGFNGTCGAGLNIEPNEGETVSNVQIQGCTFETNWAVGLGAGVPCTHNGSVTGLAIDGNAVRNNGRSGIEISKCSGTRISANTVTNNAEHGILLRACSSDTSSGANHSIVYNNTSSHNELDGIHEEYCDDNTITSNSGTGNKRYGIQSSYCTNSHFSDNTLIVHLTP